MGYTTTFRGGLDISPPITAWHRADVNKFAEGTWDAPRSPEYPGGGGYCQWVVDGNRLKWDGNEKFYDYAEWIRYLIEHFFTPWGYRLNGTISWSGEERGDVGRIIAVDSVTSVEKGPKPRPKPKPDRTAEAEKVVDAVTSCLDANRWSLSMDSRESSTHSIRAEMVVAVRHCMEAMGL